MDRLINWLAPRSVLTFCIASVYFIAVVCYHDAVQKLFYWLQGLLSPRSYNGGITILITLVVDEAYQYAVLPGGARLSGCRAA